MSVNQVDGLTPQALVPGRWWRGRFDACGGIETDRSSTQAWRPEDADIVEGVYDSEIAIPELEGKNVQGMRPR